MRSRFVLLGLVAAAAVYLGTRRPPSPAAPLDEAAGGGSAGSRLADERDSLRAFRETLRRHIAASNTYLPAMLTAGDSILRRWPPRRAQPVRVYLASPAVPAFAPELDRVVQEAFSRWQRAAEIPVSFDFVRDSAGAEVQVRWIDRFASRRAGQADVVWNRQGWLLRGTLTLATHTTEGWPLTADAVGTVALHEIGHLLGLGHSDDPADLMYPATSVHDLTLRDRRTVDLLYSLPPGSLRDP